ncbi:MAG TPA: translocation/assembly module TamB domain-containing protein [Planctomycetota bacterium]|nr:translocation/assembly module TamB domain-containing protein [Planctomycetota bacterium]
MKKRTILQGLFGTLAVLTAGLVGVYLFRWSLFGGTVRAKLSELVGTELNSDAEVAVLEGSLLKSITAREIRLRPRGGAPIRSATAEKVRVTYGFLGSGEPTLTVDSARIVLSAKDGPAPPLHETIRDVVSVLRSLRFSGVVRARNVDVVLPDGRVLSLEKGSLDHATWALTLHTDGFGTIDGSATLGLDGSFSFEGKASEGQLHHARIDLGPGRDHCPLTLSMELLGQAWTWSGTADFEKERLSRAEGDLTVKEGRAHTLADFTTGLVKADVDAVVGVDEKLKGELNGELKGELAVSGHAEGPIEGPPEAWTLRGGTLKTRALRFRDVVIDEAEVRVPRGSLAEAAFQGTARSGDDRVEAEGVFRWKGKPDVDATLHASVVDVGRWRTLLPEPIPLKALQARVDGTLALHDGAISFDGSAATGAGSYDSVAWTSATFTGSFAPGRAELREGSLLGTAFAPAIGVSGKLEGETVLVRLKAGPDEIDVGGRLGKNGDFEGRIRVEGPLDWLKSQNVSLPDSLVPIKINGKVHREKEDLRVMVDIAAGNDVTLAPTATIHHSGEEWSIALAPTTVTIPKGRVEISETLVKVAPGRVSMEDLRVSWPQPDFHARLSGWATWTERETKIVFGASDSSLANMPIETLDAQVTIDRTSGEIVPLLLWGKENGDYLRIRGRWGKELDLEAELRARDLQRPLFRQLLPGYPVEGAISLNARITGSPADPQTKGSLSLSKITTAGLPPLTLDLPIYSEDHRLKFWASQTDTPYGKLEIEGSIPLPKAPGDVDVRLRIATNDFTPLLDRMDRTARPWVPRGGLSAEISVAGPPSSLRLSGRADFSAATFKPPDPLPMATDLRLSARLDSSGVSVEMLDGILGQGPFWASGRWDCFLPGRPLSLWVTAQDALVVDDALARLRVRPDALLTWDEHRGLRLTGRLEVPLLIYHREFSTTTPGSRTAVRQVTSPKLRLIPAESGGFLIPGIEGLEALDLDLKLTTPGEVRIENSVVGILLSVDGHLGGTAADPALSGVIQSRANRGEVKLTPGTFMRVESSQIRLPEEAGRPASVTFHGRVGTGEGAIQIIVEGPTDSPTLTLKSDPPLPQKDLLAKLAFGVAPGAVTGETGAATLALYLYGQATDEWPSADRKEGFFAKFRPTVIPGDTTQHQLPWELPPTANLRSTSLRTEYVYNNYFSIIGETNREGDVGGDLKLRIRF